MPFLLSLLVAASSEDWAARTAERLATVPDDAARLAFVRQLIYEDGMEGGGEHVAALVGAARVLDQLPPDRRGPEVLRGYAEAALRGDAFDRDYLYIAAASGLLDEAGRPSLPEPDRVEAAQAAELAVVPTTWVVCVVPPEVVAKAPDPLAASLQASWVALPPLYFQPEYRRRPTRGIHGRYAPAMVTVPANTPNGLTKRSHKSLLQVNPCGDGLAPGYIEHSWRLLRGGQPAPAHMADSIFVGCAMDDRRLGLYKAVPRQEVQGGYVDARGMYVPLSFYPGGDWVWGYYPFFAADPRIEDCADAAGTTAAVAAWNGNVRRAFGLPGSPDPAPAALP